MVQNKNAIRGVRAMGVATIVEHGKGTLTIEHKGKTCQYDQGEGLEDPPMINADILWLREHQKRYEVKFAGDDLPETLIVRDGGLPGWHKYHRCA